MSRQGEPLTSWSRAAAAAGVAGPTEPGGRLGVLKRIVGRLLRPFLARQQAYNEAALGALVEVRDDLAGQIGELRRLVGPGLEGAADSDEVARLSRALDAALPVVEHQGYAIDALREVVDDQLLDRELVSQEIDLARQQAFARFHDGLGMLRRELSELSRVLSSRAEGVERRLDRAERALSAARVRLAALGGDEAVPGEVPAAGPVPAAAPAGSAPGRFLQLYASFEDAFRGSEGLIRERVSGYLPDLEPLRGTGPILDVGCGKGDFLAVLKEAGLEAYGIEVNTGYAEHWKLDELDVRVVDVLEHLAGVPAASLAAVTALQVVEHVSTDQLLEFLELALEALRPGGLLVLETPNPENLTVGANTFYLDPTHDRPVPAGLLSFLVSSQGFAEVEVRELRRPELTGLPRIPPEAPWAADLAPVRDVVERLVFGAQDYAVLARRA